MDGDKTVGATFELNVVTLTINQGSTGGTITALPAGPYHYGDAVVLTAAPAEGYGFTGWTGDLQHGDWNNLQPDDGRRQDRRSDVRAERGRSDDQPVDRRDDHGSPRQAPTTTATQWS